MTNRDVGDGAGGVLRLALSLVATLAGVTAVAYPLTLWFWVLQPDGGACLAASDCRSDTCLQSSGRAGGVCASACQPSEGCDNGMTCVALADRSYCVRTPSATIGEPCAYPWSCAEGRCAVFTGNTPAGHTYTRSYCVTPCDQGACPAEQTCRPAADGDLCEPSRRIAADNDRMDETLRRLAD